MKWIINILIWTLGINFVIDVPYKSFINISLSLLLFYFLILTILAKQIKIKEIFSLEIILLTLFVIYSTLIGSFLAKDLTVFFDKVQTLAQVLIIAIGIITTIKLNGSEKSQMYLIFSMALVMCLFLISQGSIQELDVESREQLTLGDMNPNIFGYILVMGIISIFYFLSKKEKILPWILVVALPIFVYSILQSGSRNAYIGMIITFILWFLFFYIPEKSSKKSKIFTFIPIAGMAGILYFCYTYMYNTVLSNTAVGNRLGYLTDTSQGSIAQRLYLYQEGFDLFLSSPILGVGLDQFRIHSVSGMYSHSDYIETLVNTGLIGFILYFLIYFILFTKLTTIIRRKKDYPKSVVSTSRIFQISILIMLYYGLGRPWYDQIGRWFLLATIIGFVANYKKNKIFIDEKSEKRIAENE